MSEQYRDTKRRLAMYLDKEVHRIMKRIALDKNTTVTNYVTYAIKEQIKRDIELGF